MYTARNVTRLYREAVASGVVASDWYTEAYEIAEAISAEHNIETERVAGVMAALSPLNSWGHNVRLAKRFVESGGLNSGYLKTGLGYAQRILDGEDTLNVLKGDKTRNFYTAIATAGQRGVCVDRHAFDIVVNTRHTDVTRPAIRGKRYAEVAACYERAAKILSKEFGPVTAAQVQSVTWIQWRSRYWNRGAFDYKEEMV